MPTASFFTRFGLFTRSHFLEQDLCEQLRQEMAELGGSPGSILNAVGEQVVDQNTRKTTRTKVSPATTQLVESRLIAIRPEIENHFGRSLDELEPPQFLRYRVGDFYKCHADRCDDADVPFFIQIRQVSVVVFLNHEFTNSFDQSQHYEGGALTFYGLINDPKWCQYGFSLNGEAGLLIAFPSELIHEVQPVTSGERFTIASWFGAKVISQVQTYQPCS